MTNVNQLKHILYQELKTALPLERRQNLVQEMSKLEGKNIHCFNCAGTCCTFSANSMQITPLEAFEILFSLDLNPEKIEELKIIMKNTVTSYRLDHEIFTGKKASSSLRRTYTCPFFSPGPKGCTLGRAHKPYGCLGFNPKISDDNGTSCHSHTEILEERETLHETSETIANEYLRKTYSLDWNKKDLPRALLALLSTKVFAE
jgi:Fe-S-cluster containining protein